MKVSQQSWHARWFNFVQKKLFDSVRYSDGTNLCHYMRVTMLWGPLFFGVMLLGIGVACLAAIFVFVLAPYDLLGFYGPPLAITLAAGLIYSLIKMPWLFRRYRHKFAPIGSFTHAMIEHAGAVKGRFCPLISIVSAHSEPAE